MSNRTRLLTALVAASIVFAVAGCRRETAADLLATGRDRLQRGDYAGAERKLSAAVAKAPDMASAHYSLGVAQWHLDEADKAAASLEKALELGEKDPECLDWHGQALIKARRFDEARVVYDRMFRRDGPSPRLYTTMALVEIGAERYDLAQTYLKHALDTDASYGPAIYNMGIVAKDGLKNPTLAVEFFKKYLDISPDGQQAAAARGHLAALQKTDTAIAPPLKDDKPVQDRGDQFVIGPLFEGRDRRASDANVIAATNAMARGMNDEALIVLNEVIRKDPGNADALWCMVVLYEKHLDNSSKAESMYARFRDQFPRDSRSARITRWANRPTGGENAAEAYRRGARLHQMGDFDGAVSAYRDALAVDPKMFDAAYNLGLAYKSKNALQDARDALLRAVQIQPDRVEANYMLAVVYNAMKDNARALPCLTRIVKTRPDFSRAHFMLGKVYRENQQYDLATKHFNTFLKQDPSSTLAGEAKEELDAMARLRAGRTRSTP